MLIQLEEDLMKKILSTMFAFVLAFTALGVNPLVNADEYEYVWSSTNGAEVSTVVRNGVRYERLAPTSANNTTDKAGEFRRNDMKWNWDELDGSASFEFVADSEPGGA